MAITIETDTPMFLFITEERERRAESMVPGDHFMD